MSEPEVIEIDDLEIMTSNTKGEDWLLSNRQAYLKLVEKGFTGSYTEFLALQSSIYTVDLTNEQCNFESKEKSIKWNSLSW